MEGVLLVRRRGRGAGGAWGAGGSRPTPARGARAEAGPCLDWQVTQCSQAKATSAAEAGRGGLGPVLSPATLDRLS